MSSRHGDNVSVSEIHRAVVAHAISVFPIAKISVFHRK